MTCALGSFMLHGLPAVCLKIHFTHSVFTVLGNGLPFFQIDPLSVLKDII